MQLKWVPLTIALLSCHSGGSLAYTGPAPSDSASSVSLAFEAEARLSKLPPATRPYFMVAEFNRAGSSTIVGVRVDNDRMFRERAEGETTPYTSTFRVDSDGRVWLVGRIVTPTASNY
jgi:hypothetical protein